MATKRKRIVVDAAGLAPGRLATKIAMILMGKNKPSYTPHIDSGDKVIVLNSGNIKFTGKKAENKVYRHHSMHPGGLKEISVKKVLKENPQKVILSAVMKMLPKNKMRTARMRRISFK